jgi:hypothetical protein
MRIGLVAAAAALLVGGPVAAAVLLRPQEAPSTAVAEPAPASSARGPRQLRFPAPPRGAVVYSRELGSDALALAVVPGRGPALLQASVVGPEGDGVSGLEVAFAGGRAPAAATPCGRGCYRARVPLGDARTVRVDVRSPSVRWTVALPQPWPPRDARALVVRAGRAWRSLRSVSFRETLASSPRHRVASTWRLQAPDRVAYQVEGGWAAIVVGRRRWDRPPGGRRWTPSAQTRLPQPVPPWVAVTDAHVIGRAVVGDRPAWRITFFDPRTPAWFEAAVDRSTYRTLDLRMVTTAHFMHDAYGQFNSAQPIAPP